MSLVLEHSVTFPLPLDYRWSSELRTDRNCVISVRSTDLELIDAAIQGDEPGFRILVQRYQPIVLKTVRGMLGDAMDVDDVVQETFVRLYAALPKFRRDAALKTFITRIAINRCLDSLRRRKRRFFVPWDANREENHPRASDSSDSRVIRNEQWRDLRAAIDKLSPNQRSVVVLRLVNGLSTQETSDVLSVPYGTVLSRLNRAVVRLREQLSSTSESRGSAEERHSDPITAADRGEHV